MKRIILATLAAAGSIEGCKRQLPAMNHFQVDGVGVFYVEKDTGVLCAQITQNSYGTWVVSIMGNHNEQLIPFGGLRETEDWVERTRCPNGGKK